MPIDIINAITRLLHELWPWAGVVVAAISAWQAKRAKEVSKEAATKIEEVHQSINGRMDEVVKAAAEKARLEGYIQAKEEVQNKTGSSQ